MKTEEFKILDATLEVKSTVKLWITINQNEKHH